MSHFDLDIGYVKGSQNPADGPSRYAHLFLGVTESFKGEKELSKIKQLLVADSVAIEICQYFSKGSHKPWHNKVRLFLH